MRSADYFMLLKTQHLMWLQRSSLRLGRSYNPTVWLSLRSRSAIRNRNKRQASRSTKREGLALIWWQRPAGPERKFSSSSSDLWSKPQPFNSCQGR